jgi:hypothetical protein
MSKIYKLLQKIIQGNDFLNIRFDELCSLLIHLGFEERTKGSHHIFSKNGMDEIINVQSIGSSAKPYQVKQVRQIIIKYNLQRNFDDKV